MGEKGFHPTPEIGFSEGVESLGHSNWTICSLFSHFWIGKISNFWFSYSQKRMKWVFCAWEHWPEQKCLLTDPGTHLFMTFCPRHIVVDLFGDHPLCPLAVNGPHLHSFRATASSVPPATPSLSLPCCVWHCLWSMPTLWYKEKVSGAEIRPQSV